MRKGKTVFTARGGGNTLKDRDLIIVGKEIGLEYTGSGS